MMVLAGRTSWIICDMHGKKVQCKMVSARAKRGRTAFDMCTGWNSYGCNLTHEERMLAVHVGRNLTCSQLALHLLLSIIFPIHDVGRLSDPQRTTGKDQGSNGCEEGEGREAKVMCQ